MKSTFRVLFFLKRDKVKKNGNMPIMARITIDGKLAQFNTKLEVNPKNWQAKTGKVSGRGAEFTRMNEMLDGIKATLYKHYQTILERDGYVTAEKVRNTFLGKEEKAKALLQVFWLCSAARLRKRNKTQKLSRTTTTTPLRRAIDGRKCCEFRSPTVMGAGRTTVSTRLKSTGRT